MTIRRQTLVDSEHAVDCESKGVVEPRRRVCVLEIANKATMLAVKELRRSWGSVDYYVSWRFLEEETGRRPMTTKTHEDSQTLAPSQCTWVEGGSRVPSTQQSAGGDTQTARYSFPHPRPGRRVWWGMSRKGPKRLPSALDPFGLGQEQGSLSCVRAKISSSQA